MKIYYLNCGTMHPRLFRWFLPDLAIVPSLCMLIESRGCLILVDTGLGTMDMKDPGRLGTANIILNALPDPAQTAMHQIISLGFSPGEVRHVICTHLDRDHAGGLQDFPHAKVHVLKEELEAVMHPVRTMERERYRKCHFEHNPDWILHDMNNISGEKWFGMDCIRDIADIPEEIVLIPLQGHTRGHVGVAIYTGKEWILHCGDAYYVKKELDESGKEPFGLRCFKATAHINHSMAIEQLSRLRRLAAESNGRIRLISSHDRQECENLTGKPVE